MYLIENVPIRPSRGIKRGIRLPLNVLLTLPSYVTERLDPKLFSLPQTILRLFGSYGWESALKIITPRIWAPGWTDDELRRFLINPQLGTPWPAPTPPVGVLRAEAFSFTEPQVSEDARIHYDIVHFVGYVRGPDPELDLPESPQARRAGALRDRLVDAGTQLLILQLQAIRGTTRKDIGGTILAKSIAGGGGPAVLVINSGEAPEVQTYLFDLYANLMHRQSLSEAARPRPELDRKMDVNLVLGEDADSLFSFEPLIEDLQRSFAAMEVSEMGVFRELQVKARSLLHGAQRTEFEPLRRADEIMSAMEDSSKELLEIAGRTWTHESEGVIPLVHIAERIAELKAVAAELFEDRPKRLPPQRGRLSEPEFPFTERLTALAERAPRVLNANFRDPREQRMLASDGALVAGSEYELLVDIGPRWDKHESIVGGHADFPDKALPPSEEGHVLDLALVSQDFTPNVVSAQVWLPSRTGRSFSYSNSERAERPGPVVLTVTAPSFSQDVRAPLRARGRLCVYFANNLLQSAAVDVCVVNSADDQPEGRNTITVDYALTGGFREFGELDQRAVCSSPERSNELQRITLNIALNDDGSGSHRILVKGHSEPEPTWIAYDPKNDALDRARETLEAVQWLRNDETGEFLLGGNNQSRVATDNVGKALTQFKWDLLKLAELGSELFSMVFVQANTGGKGKTALEWVRELRLALKDSSVIQVARTGPANYVFPWALVYEHPLTAPTSQGYKFCKVVREWSNEGVRRNPEWRKCCPYQDEEFHQENVLCPYGFWGLKHVVEQPQSLDLTDGAVVLRNVARSIAAEGVLALQVALTSDSALDRQLIESHLRHLQGLLNVSLRPAIAAGDWEQVCSMLNDPVLVYFLCHGEYDQMERDAFLGVGPRDDDPVHRIYRKRLTAKLSTLDAQRWRRRRPLVFINGCHTCDLKPGEVLNFASAFIAAGASGVIGTEVSVLLQVAAEIAESLLGRIARGVPVGQAMREVRWELANKGNLLGLAYTLYGLADLTV